MKKQISMTDIEEIIKEKLKNNGVYEMIGEDKISEIKNKVKDIILSKKLEEVDSQPTNAKPTNSNPVNPVETNVSNPNISVKTTQDPEKVEIVKKETELELKEKELNDKEAKLLEKEKELEQKEKELSYKPELPEKIKEVDAAEIIVFSENELSASIENLSERGFRLKSNPDEKVSPKDLWLKDTITKSNVYLVELKPIGQLVFDPYNGTTTLENIDEKEVVITTENPYENSAADIKNSQIPENEMLDMIEPIKNVTQQIVNPGHPEPAESGESQEFKEMIEKIIRDEISKRDSRSQSPGPTTQSVY